MAVAQVLVTILALTTGLGWAQDARAPPSIRDPGTAYTSYRLVDSTVDVLCGATGNPPPTYQWHYHKDYAPYNNSNTIVSANNPPGDKATFNETHGILTITGLTLDQTGYYYCRATNVFDNNGGGGVSAAALSPAVEIRLSYMDDWPEEVKTRVRSVTSKAGEYAFIKCDQLPGSSGPVNIKWYRRTEGDADDVSAENDRIFTDQQGTLWFSSMQEGDKGLPYSCGIVEALTGNRFMGSTVDVTVTPGDGVDISPQLRYNTGDLGKESLTFLRGHEARLECFFSGDPVPEITWKDRNGVIVSDGHYSFEDFKRVLVIKNVGEEDEGKFICEGKNPVGTRASTLDVNITSPPYWESDFQTEQMVAEGTDAVLGCRARSMPDELPPDRPVWYRNGQPMGQGYDREKYQFREGMRTLTVRNVSKKADIACYQCFVTNSVGQLFGQTCVNIFLPIQILYRPREQQSVAHGEMVNLTVVAVSDPSLTLHYEWIFNNATYRKEETPPHVIYDRDTRVALINTSKLTVGEFKEINGTYMRRVYHLYQSKFVAVEVTLRYDVAVASFPYWIIGLIIALLILLLIIIICCCVCCRRKMQEGDYPVDRKETAAGLDPEREVKESAFPDLSRAPDPYQTTKPSPMDMDGQSVRDDESFASTEYGEEPTAFNEDGSFIGAYKAKAKDKEPVLSPAFQNNVQSRVNPAFQNGNESSV